MANDTVLDLNLDQQYSALIDQFSALTTKMNAFINGDKNTTIVTDAGTIKSLSGVIADLNKFRFVQKIIDHNLYADMIADDINIDVGMLIRIFGDTSLINGIYLKSATGVYGKINYANLYGLTQIP
jgi:hypothetical protein